MSDDAGPLNKALAAAGKSAVAPVVAAVQATVPRVSGDLAGTIRSSGTKSGAAVRMGSAAVPYAGAVDFGGYPPDSYPYESGGRYLFPAAETLASTAADLYAQGTQHALDAFAWTNETNNAKAVHD
jgi:hypothetical protein